MDLDGLRVVDLTTLLPGPYATQLLADMGAAVIKVERPDGGDPARTLSAATGPDVFGAVNRGKQSVTLDLQTDEGRAAFRALAADADVVIEGFRPGVVERLGVDYETVRNYNPDVVYCSLTGFGATGPHRDRAGHDLNYVGMAGLLDTTRSKAGEVAIPGYPVADMAGGLYAVVSILGALLSRELGGGGGEHLDVSMTDAVLALSQAVAADAFEGGDPTGRETALTGQFPFYDVYETADGELVTLAALEPRFFQSFCAAIDRPDLAAKQLAGGDEREALGAAIAEEIGSRTLEECLALGEETMVAPVWTVPEALDSDHVEARDLVWGQESAAGPRVGVPAIASGGFEAEESVPDLGAHTESALRAAGYDEAGIEELRDADVI